jgi:hypothetical protein
LFSNNRKVQRARPLGGLEQAKAIRTKWKSATRAKITPDTKENVFSSMSDHPKFSG